VPRTQEEWAASEHAAAAWHGDGDAAAFTGPAADADTADAGYYEEQEAGYEEEEEEEGEGSGAQAAFAAGEVIWQAGDALDEEEGDGGEEAFELSDEWAARFAQTEHRRAQRAPARRSLAPSHVLTLPRPASARRRQAAGARDRLGPSGAG
jgi:hypothetical protein